MKLKSRDLTETITKLEALRATIRINPKCYPTLDMSPVETHAHDKLSENHWTANLSDPRIPGEFIEVCANTFTELVDKLWGEFSRAIKELDGPND